MQLLTYGGLTLDYLELADGRTYLGIPGGNALYSAAGARLWSKETEIAGRVGSDYPAHLLSQVAAAGIHIGCVQHIAQPHIQVYPARYKQDGQREHKIPARAYQACTADELERLTSFLDSKRHLQAIQPFMLHPHDFAAECLQVAAFHCAPVPIANQIMLAAAFRGNGAIVSLDPNLWDMQALEDESALGELLSNVDLFLPSREEVVVFLPQSSVISRQTLETCARKFAAMGPAVVAIKLGSDGSLVFDRVKDKMYSVPSFPTRAIDPTGAGDAYCGGFCAGYLKTGDALRAGLMGTVSASFAIEAPGVEHLLHVSRGTAQERLSYLEGYFG